MESHLTSTEHPITPPPELEQRLVNGPGTWREKIVNAYRAGADAELEAILKIPEEPDLSEEDTYFDGLTVAGIRENRRPKPPSLAELALRELERIIVLLMPVTGSEKIRQRLMLQQGTDAAGLALCRWVEDVKRFNTIRAALERLQELENNG